MTTGVENALGTIELLVWWFFGNPEPPSQLALLSKQTLTLENIKQALHKFKDNKGSDDVGVVAERANFALVDLDRYCHCCTITCFLTMWQPHGPSHVSSCSPSQTRALDAADFRPFGLRLYCVNYLNAWLCCMIVSRIERPLEAFQLEEQ